MTSNHSLQHFHRLVHGVQDISSTGEGEREEVSGSEELTQQTGRDERGKNEKLGFV